MPRYYFDYLDGPKSLQDDEGTELPDLEAARAEGLETLGLVAKDELPDGDHRDFRISIRQEDGPVLMVLSLLLRVARKHT